MKRIFFALKNPKISYRYFTRNKRVLPNFIIIGSSRSGTTALYHYLTQHPQVLPAFRKEIHFFSQSYSRGIDWYKLFFPTKEEIGLSKLTGEASPRYMFHYKTPMRIKETLEGVKLIALLRNPVDRAYSHYTMMTKGKRLKETLEFEKAIDLAFNNLRSDYQERLPYIDNPKQLPIEDFRVMYLFMGLYYEAIKKWKDLFGNDQLLVLKTEDLSKNTKEVVNTVYEYLGLPSYELSLYRRKNVSRYTKPMSTSVRTRLEEFFKNPNEQLYEYLNWKEKWY